MQPVPSGKTHEIQVTIELTKGLNAKALWCKLWAVGGQTRVRALLYLYFVQYMI